jgi:hypothetical protein
METMPTFPARVERGEDMPEVEKRSYQRTSFKLFILCLAITVVSEYAGVSLQQVTAYADGILKKTFENLNTIVLWAWPIATMVKEGVDDWRKSMHSRDIEVERLRNGK